MLRNIMLLSFMAFVPSCLSFFSVKRGVFIDERGLKYYSSFIEDARVYDITVTPENLTLIFKPELGKSKEEREILGWCMKTWQGVPVIAISESTWIKLSECQKKALVYHELGHCLLNQEHRDGYLIWDMPKSWMNNSMIPKNYCELNESYYIDEFFKGGGNESEKSDGTTDKSDS